MAYEDQAALAQDGAFLNRLEAATQEQAMIFKDDGRPDIASVADRLLADSGQGISWFRWPVATQPGFADAYAGGGSEAITDAQILSAVQAVWPTVAAVHPAEQPMEPQRTTRDLIMLALAATSCVVLVFVLIGSVVVIINRIPVQEPLAALVSDVLQVLSVLFGVVLGYLARGGGRNG